jgi:hypothetical protein
MPLAPVIAAAACALAAHGQLPDSHCTPRALQSHDARAICTSGWAGRHRHVADSERAEVYHRYGLHGPHPFPEWEVDHRVPLEVGARTRSAISGRSITRGRRIASSTRIKTGRPNIDRLDSFGQAAIASA